MTEHSPLPRSAYLILGLLSFGEMSGYVMKQFADKSVALFYASPARSQVYSELRHLAERGYATEREVEQTARPDKRIYSITGPGESALRDWLENTPTSADVLKSHLLLKVFFGSRMDRATLIREVHQHRDEALKFRETLNQLLVDCQSEPGSLFVYLTVSKGIAYSHADEAWASEALELLESADEEFTWSGDQAPSVTP